MSRGLGSAWEMHTKLADDEHAEWWLARRARGYREPPERALLVCYRDAGAVHRESVERSLREDAPMAMSIRSPLFQRVLEFEARPRPYLALEVIEAVPLRRILAAGEALSVRAVATLGLALSRGVAELQKTDAPSGDPLAMIARDLGPDSVWVTRAGDLRAANPVLASFITTNVSDVVLPPPERFDFLAPEQALGEALEPETGVFALGLLLLALLLGRSPFLRSRPFETLSAIVEQDLSHAEFVVAPEALRALLMRALEKDPKKRPPSARAFHRELEVALRADAIDATARLGAAVNEMAPEVCGMNPWARRFRPPAG